MARAATAATIAPASFDSRASRPVPPAIMRSTRRFALRSLLLKTSAATAPNLARSVIAVPPLARFSNRELNVADNLILIRHFEEGGVTTLMYGGNAYFY